MLDELLSRAMKIGEEIVLLRKDRVIDKKEFEKRYIKLKEIYTKILDYAQDEIDEIQNLGRKWSIVSNAVFYSNSDPKVLAEWEVLNSEYMFVEAIRTIHGEYRRFVLEIKNRFPGVRKLDDYVIASSLKAPEVFFKEIKIEKPKNLKGTPEIDRNIYEGIINELESIILRDYRIKIDVQFVKKNLGYAYYYLKGKRHATIVIPKDIEGYRILGAFLHEVSHVIFYFEERKCPGELAYNKEYCANVIAIDLIRNLPLTYRSITREAFEAFVNRTLEITYDRMEKERKIFYEGIIPKKMDQRVLGFLARFPFHLLAIYNGLILIRDNINKL